jgi:hypothetical protein
MKNKKVVILIILGVTAVFSLLYGIFTPSQSRRPSPMPAGEGVFQSRPTPSAAALFLPRRRAAKSKYLSWKRNLFVSKETPHTPSATLTLNGIMWSEKNPKAMINGVVARKKDKIDSCTVVDIKRDRVFLNDGSKDFELVLEE